MIKVQESKEMYLETILILTKRNGTVRSIDVASEMSFSKPSVSRAMGILKSENLINVDKHGLITLTDMGKELAHKVLERHDYLKRLLISLGVNQEIADGDACRIEHVISDETFEVIKEYINTNK